jgi:uncharacterized protein (DUF1330 family)
MSAYLINHLRIPGGIPNEEGLSYLEQVESTTKAYGGKWLALGNVEVVEGAWPGSVVLMEFPSMTDARNWYHSSAYQKILHLRVNNAIPIRIVLPFSAIIRAPYSTRAPGPIVTSPQTVASGATHAVGSIFGRLPACSMIMTFCSRELFLQLSTPSYLASRLGCHQLVIVHTVS